MNNNNVYTCRTTLTGIEDRKENDFYFRCKDQPYATTGRNVNTQSYLYSVIGTQPLNIMEIGPNETIFGATDVIPVYLTVKTDNGYNNGESVCYYSTTGDENDYIQFLETNQTNNHKQRQDLTEGDYTYYIKCVDLGGNAAYNVTNFEVKTDRSGPAIVRAFKQDNQLNIITDEKADCSYSNKDCNFEIDSGIKMTTLDYRNHGTDWATKDNFYIRCKDKYNNQPNPNECSIIIRPSELKTPDKNTVIIL